MARLLNA